MNETIKKDLKDLSQELITIINDAELLKAQYVSFSLDQARELERIIITLETILKYSSHEYEQNGEIAQLSYENEHLKYVVKALQQQLKEVTLEANKWRIVAGRR